MFGVRYRKLTKGILSLIEVFPQYPEERKKSERGRGRALGEALSIAGSGRSGGF
jgi:hypothetical protein